MFKFDKQDFEQIISISNSVSKRKRNQIISMTAQMNLFKSQNSMSRGGNHRAKRNNKPTCCQPQNRLSSEADQSWKWVCPMKGKHSKFAIPLIKYFLEKINNFHFQSKSDTESLICSWTEFCFRLLEKPRGLRTCRATATSVSAVAGALVYRYLSNSRLLVIYTLLKHRVGLCRFRF